MAYDIPLKSDPSPLPLKPAVLILLHRRRRAAFVGYTTNARGRANVLANAIRHRPSGAAAKGRGKLRNHLRDMPEGTVRDFALLATHIGLDKNRADKAVARLQRKLERDGYKIFGGTRSAQPKITYNGKRMTLVEAMVQAKAKDAYQTIYRRIQRGWPVKDALQ